MIKDHFPYDASKGQALFMTIESTAGTPTMHMHASIYLLYLTIK
jgi:hypothetical protein